MKKLMAVMAMMISMNVMAAEEVMVGPSSNQFITPDIATTVFRTSTFTYDKNHDILVCPLRYSVGYNECYDKDRKPQWQYMKNIAGPGRKFMGFRTFIYRTTEYIEIYIK